MKLGTLGISASAAICVCAGLAGAVTVNFDVFPGPDEMLGTADDVAITAPTSFGTQTIQLTDEFASVGLLFTPDPSINDQNEILSNTTFTTPPTATDPNLLASSGTAPITGSFTTPLDTLGALLGISGGSDQLEVFDTGGVSLGSIVGDDTFQMLDPASPIASFRITPFTSTTSAIDNLTFTFIPEPAAATLLAAALLPLRRRR